MTQQQTPQRSQPRPHYPFRLRAPRLWPGWLLLGVGIAIAVAYALGSLPGTHPASTTHTVLYEATADAAYGSGRTGFYTEQTPSGTVQGKVALPATQTLTFHTGDFVYLSVQNQQPAGSVTCRITVDGHVVSENTSTGGYTIATCQGKIG